MLTDDRRESINRALNSSMGPGMRRVVVALSFIAAAAAFVVFFGDRRSSDQSPATGVSDRIKNAASTVIVKEIENPECAKLLDHIKSKTAAVLQKISPSGHEILLVHPATKSTISLDCATSSKMSMTFISKDSSPTDDWFAVIGAAGDVLVNTEPSLIIAEARKCLSAAKKDPTTSAQEEVSGFDVDCALPQGDESGYLVAVMAADPVAQNDTSAAAAKTNARKTGGKHRQ